MDPQDQDGVLFELMWKKFDGRRFRVHYHPVPVRCRMFVAGLDHRAPGMPGPAAEIALLHPVMDSSQDGTFWPLADTPV